MTKHPPSTPTPTPILSHPPSHKSPKEKILPPSILPATSQDIPALAHIHVTALSPNLLFRLCWPNQTKHYKSVRTGLEAQFKNPELEWWFVKAVDDDGTIMGWGAWTVRPADLGSRYSNLFFLDGVDGSSEEDIELEDFPIVPGLPDYLHEQTRVILDGWLLGKKHLLLNALFVEPRYQRRGVGNAILKWGIERADKEGVPCFLKSTPVAWPLYKGLGWKEVGTLDVDLRDWVRENANDSGWGRYRVRFGLRLPDVWKNDKLDAMKGD